MSRATLRAAVALLLPCVAVVALFAVAVWSKRAVLRARLPVEQTDPVPFAAVEAWARRPARGGVMRGVIFGDSLGYCPDNVYVGQSIARLVADGGPGIDMLEIRRGAFRPLVYACFLDDVLAGRPQVAVVEVNVRLFSDAVTYAPAMRFFPLSRRLSLRRIWQLRTALVADEVGLLGPLLYRLSERLDALDVVAGLEAAGRDWLDGLGRAASLRAGIDPSAPGTGDFAAFAASLRESGRAQYHVEFAEHPAAGVLREMGTAIRAAGAVVVFYVSPIPLQHLRRLGVLDEADLSARIERLRAAIGATPGEWVDLHALVDDERVFRDDVGHMFRAGCERVAAEVAPRVRALVTARMAP